MKSYRALVLYAFFCITSANQAHAQLCKQWSEPVTVGEIQSADLDEASGLTVSGRNPGRLYWINDSGAKARLYLTDEAGRLQKKVKFADKKSTDTEALAYGPCGSQTCLVIGDIGDNKGKREFVRLIFIKELPDFPKSVSPWLQLKVKYPDGPRNAEAMTILPDGDLMIVSKKNADVYVLPKADFAAPGAEREKVLRKLGHLPLDEWLKDADSRGRLVTDMAYDPRRDVIGLLTYQKAVEIPLKKMADLANTARWHAGTDYAVVPLRPLMQQETLTYNRGQLLWSSEIPLGSEAPLNSLSCGDNP